MAEDTAVDKSAPFIFVVARADQEREAIRGLLMENGFLAVGLRGIEETLELLRNQAACSLILIFTDALGNSPAPFDALAAAIAGLPPPHPKIVIHGIDPTAQLVLHSLNHGASDFLVSTAAPAEILMVVENAVYGGVVDADNAADRPDAIQATSPITNWIELTASSRMEQLRRIQRFSDALFATHLPPQVCEDLRLAVEEVGRNAVEWGNNFNPDKRVHVSYCIFADRIVIKVEDEGDGFVPSKVPDPTVDPLKTMLDRKSAGKRAGGYGVFLIQKLVDDMVYNEKGNTVLLIKYLR